MKSACVSFEQLFSGNECDFSVFNVLRYLAWNMFVDGYSDVLPCKADLKDTQCLFRSENIKLNCLC